jgi:hypothetical protein
MWLTGFADGPPLLAPAGITAAIDSIGCSAGVDAFALLAERAALLGLSRHGATSCGRGSRLLRCGDGDYIAVSLLRVDDIALLPAWIGVDGSPAHQMDDLVWGRVERAVAECSGHDLVARGITLGLAVSRLEEVAETCPVEVTTEWGDVGSIARRPVVIDLSSLWAGPLATRLLRDAGARVIKVESRTRPDGARSGDKGFFDLMNGGKESVALDFRSPADIDALRGLLHAADVVVEASRPRALEHLGVDAAAILAEGLHVWLSITGFGRSGPNANRVAFGDDAAVGAGLVADDGNGPCFVADAVADPLTGIVAASAALAALRSGTRTLLDVAMTRVAHSVAVAANGEPWIRGSDAVARRPTARPARAVAPNLGEHTDAVLREFL